jgi:hypothetical protein
VGGVVRIERRSTARHSYGVAADRQGFGNRGAFAMNLHTKFVGALDSIIVAMSASLSFALLFTLLTP